MQHITDVVHAYLFIKMRSDKTVIQQRYEKYTKTLMFIICFFICLSYILYTCVSKS